MSSKIQLPIDKRVPCRGVLDPPGFFSVLGQLGLGEVTNNQVHPSCSVFGTEDLLFSLDTRLVEPLYEKRD
ncbi:hypothetical protein TIFTF001_028906 [Ficus carica]|uniref:Uncharacterized protein n=1 Tax=Ficus carica TaxID=3494 RepID=A0AA88DQU0_FICCA|nr:hypothetical protein TIFTF001_028906 [Ficus carica]